VKVVNPVKLTNNRKRGNEFSKVEPVKVVKPVKQALLLLWLRSNAFTVFTGSQFQKAISAINHPFSHPYSLRTEKHDMETVKGVKPVKFSYERGFPRTTAARRGYDAREPTVQHQRAVRSPLRG